MFLTLLLSLTVSAAEKPKTESYKDLISKARHLTFQRDRLQATQVLIRGLSHEGKNTQAYKELLAALNELSGVFYTEKAQSLFLMADAAELEKPKDAIDKLNEALRLEEGNLSILNSLARAYLRLGECSNANKPITAAKEINPYSPELKLLTMQLADCEKNYDQLSTLLTGKPDESDPTEKFTKGLRMQSAEKAEDHTAAKNILKSWEASQPEYPEVYYWKFKESLTSTPDRASAQKYISLCQNLSPRKKKSYNLDIELCKSVEKVVEDLKKTSSETGDDDDDSP